MALSGIGEVHCGSREWIVYNGYNYLDDGNFFDGTDVGQCSLYNCKSCKSHWRSLNTMVPTVACQSNNSGGSFKINSGPNDIKLFVFVIYRCS